MTDNDPAQGPPESEKAFTSAENVQEAPKIKKHDIITERMTRVRSFSGSEHGQSAVELAHEVMSVPEMDLVRQDANRGKEAIRNSIVNGDTEAVPVVSLESYAGYGGADKRFGGADQVTPQQAIEILRSYGYKAVTEALSGGGAEIDLSAARAATVSETAYDEAGNATGIVYDIALPNGGRLLETDAFEPNAAQVSGGWPEAVSDFALQYVPPVAEQAQPPIAA